MSEEINVECNSTVSGLPTEYTCRIKNSEHPHRLPTPHNPARVSSHAFNLWAIQNDNDEQGISHLNFELMGNTGSPRLPLSWWEGVLLPGRHILCTLSPLFLDWEIWEKEYVILCSTIEALFLYESSISSRNSSSPHHRVKHLPLSGGLWRLRGASPWMGKPV